MSNGLKPRKPQGSWLPKRQMMFVVYNHLNKTPRYLGSMKPFSVSVIIGSLRKTFPHIFFLVQSHISNKIVGNNCCFWYQAPPALLKLHLIYHVGSYNREFSLEHPFFFTKIESNFQMPNGNRNQPNPHGHRCFPFGDWCVEPKILRTHLEWNHLAGLYLWFHVVTPRWVKP